MGGDAQVRTVAEPEMRVGIGPLDVVFPWVREDLCVPVAGVVEQVDPLTGLDVDAADPGVRERRAQEPARRRGPAQRLLDRPVEQAGIRPDRPLGPDDIRGLPLTDKIWDEA